MCIKGTRLRIVDGLRQEQANNTQKSKWLTYDGRTQTMLDWSKELHINYSTLRARIRKGWSVQDALTRPT